jgi:hypothetical protein
VLRAWNLFDQVLIHKLFQVVIEGTGAEFIAAFGLADDFQDDAITMPVLRGKRKQDMENRR